MPRPRRGAYLVVAAIGLSVLMAAGAVVVERRWRDLTEAQASAAAEAAAHAAAVVLARGGTLDEARALAVAVAAQNRVAGDPARVDPLQDVVFGVWDFEARAFDPTAPRLNAVEVLVRPPGDPLRWLFAGSGQRAATARVALRSRDVVVALDLADPSAAEPALAALADDLAYLALPDERLAIVPLAGLADAEASGWLGGERPLAARVLVIVSDGGCGEAARGGATLALADALGEDGVHVVPIAVGAEAGCLAGAARGYGRPAAVADPSALGPALTAVARSAPIAVVSP